MEHIENFKRAREQRAEHARVGTAWSTDEMRELLRAYVDDAPLSAIARTYSRTERGIISRVHLIADRISDTADRAGIPQKILDISDARKAARVQRALRELS